MSCRKFCFSWSKSKHCGCTDTFYTSSWVCRKCLCTREFARSQAKLPSWHIPCKMPLRPQETLQAKCFVRDEILQTSSKNCCVRLRMCLSSVSSRKFFLRASWLVLISLSSFSSFSKVAYKRSKGYMLFVALKDIHSTFAFFYFELCMRFLYLQVNHVSWKRDLRVLPCVYNWYVSLFDFFLNKSLKRKKPQNNWDTAQKIEPEKNMLTFFALNLIRTHDAIISSSLCQQCWLNNLLSLRSISSQRRTSFTNFLWKTFTSGFNCNSKGRKGNWPINKQLPFSKRQK